MRLLACGCTLTSELPFDIRSVCRNRQKCNTGACTAKPQVCSSLLARHLLHAVVDKEILGEDRAQSVKLEQARRAEQTACRT